MFVYVIVNDVNLKIYVGKTTQDSLQHYLTDKVAHARRGTKVRSHLYAAIRKYGREHFHIYSLFQGQTNEEICEQEKVLIKALKAQHPEIGYNICRGGEGFTGPHSEKAKKKNSEASKRMWQRPEIRANFSAKMTGHATSPETVEKIKAKRAEQDESVRLEAFNEWKEQKLADDPDHFKKIGAAASREDKQRAGRMGSKEDKRKAGLLGAKLGGPKARHVRWHVMRGKPNPECPLCGS